MKNNIKNITLTFLLLVFSQVLQAKIVELKSCKLSIQNHGQQQHKKSLFFFSGLTSSTRAFYPLMDRLKAEKLPFNLVTVNTPPSENSSLKNEYSWKNIQTCMAQFLKGKQNYTLVFHDLSSAMILPILKDLNELPKGIILMNALIRPSEYRFVYPFTLLRDRFASKVTSQIFPLFLYKKEIKKISFHNSKLMDEKTIDEIFSETLGGNPDELSQVIQGYPSSPALDQVIKHSLANPKIKQLVIWGLEDPIMKNQLQFLDETSKHPQRETFLLRKAKHFLMWEYAREISSVIKHWLLKNKM